MRNTTVLSAACLLGLLSACSAPNTPDVSDTSSRPATPQEIAEQLADYDARSEVMVNAVSEAMRPGATAQSISAAALNPEMQQKLEAIRREVLAKHPILAKQNVWIGESSQLITEADINNVTSKLNGLIAVVTNDPANPRKVAVVAKLSVNLDARQVTAYEVPTTLTGGYLNPALLNIQPDGGVPYVRRVIPGGGGDIDLYQPIHLMSLSLSEDSQEREAVMYHKRTGERIR